MNKPNVPEAAPSCEKAAISSDETLDLRGKKCPMTFVHTKLALEKMQTHQVLQVILDYAPSFTNVPRSLLLQQLGEVVKEQEGPPGEKILWIRKSQIDNSDL
jgi:tRNA 2-thiouridine synthesizing protein A